MLIRRGSRSGLLGVLLALAVQLGLGASVPHVNPAAALVQVQALCHADTNAPSPAPAHLPDCLACPLCAALHAPATLLAAAGVEVTAPAIPPVARAERTPPARAPPVRERPPSQSRAPPVLRLHA